MKDSLKRNAKDKVFKSLLHNRENLVKFYYDLTGERIDPKDIIYNTIATSIMKGKEDYICFQIGNRNVILFEAQSSWSQKDILRFATYMFLLFIHFIEEHEEEIFETNRDIDIPVVEAYVIYTGSRDLADVVSLDDYSPNLRGSMINASMKIVTSKNAKGMVSEYIEFSNLETKYYTDGRRDKEDVIELIDHCIKKNILKNYMLDHKSEVINLIENFFTEERRIKGLINEAVFETQQQLEKAQAEILEKDKLINEMRANEIKHLSEQNLSPEKIVEITGSSPELVKEVLEEN